MPHLSGFPMRFLPLSAVLFAALMLSACHEKIEEKPHEEMDVLYNKAMGSLNEGNTKEAVEEFSEVERQYPYSDWAVRAPVMSAYASYKGRRYDEAVTTLDSFLQMHPSNEQAPYAYYLKALCYYEQISDVGRDQKITQQSLSALREVVNRYPDSDYARDARIKIDLTYDHLAGKEMEVGRYYLTRGENLAALNRFKTVVEKYQTTSHTPEALLRLTEIYLRLGIRAEAEKYASVLGYNFPGTPWYRDAYKLLEPEKAREGGTQPPPSTWQKIKSVF